MPGGAHLKYVRRKSFGPFEVVAHLDTGGMAEVYLARHHADESLAVVKLILEHYRAHKELLQMFRLEGRIMTLLDHPNVVKVTGTGDDESGLPYIVMEYLAGDHLGVLLRASQKHHTPMSPSLIARIAIQVANGLAYVHDATDRKGKPLDLVHRDVSPQNIFLCYDGRVKLLDFGVAHTSRRGVSTDSGLLKGKLNYMSPEQIRGERFDGRSDIFALGIVMWQLITGKSLFHSEIEYKIMKMITEEPIPTTRDERPGIPKALDAIVMRCLERSPKNRFQSAAELRKVLSHFLFFGGQQGSANELPLFADHVLDRRKRKKESIISSIRREIELRERLFSDIGDELMGSEWLEEKRREKAFTPVKPILQPDSGESGEDAYSTSDVRCEWCGARIKIENLRPGAERRCEWCRESTGEVLLEETGPVWMVRKPDRSTIGPLTIMQVMQKFEAGEVEASDLLAKQDSDFRLISSYPEFAPFFRLPGKKYDVPPGRRWYRNAVILAMLVLVIAAAVIWFYSNRPVEQTVTVLDRTMESFSREIRSPEGTSSQAVSRGRKLMFADNPKAYAAADRAYKEALLLDNQSIPALAGWVQNKAMLDFGRPDVKERKEALDLIDYALEKTPDASELHRARAFLFYSLGNNAPALESATRAFELGEEGDPENLLILGAVHLAAEPELSAKYLKKALDADPNLLLANRLLARSGIRLGRFREALSLLEKRLKRAPDEFETQRAIAEIYLSAGQTEKAIETYQKILHPNPLHADPLVQLSRIQSQLLQQPALAMKTTQDFLDSHRDLSKADRALVLTEQSVALRLLGKRRQAKNVIEDALRQDPTSVVARYAQAVLEHEMGDKESALPHLKALRAELPQSARVLARMSEVQSLVPNFEAAQKDLKRALKLQPRDLDIHLMLAGLHLYLDNPTQAYEQLNQAVDIDPFYDDGHRKTTAFFDGPSLLRLTARRIKKSASKFSSNPLTHALQGIILYRSGSSKKSRSALLKALDLDSGCFPANLYLGAMELSNNRAKEALTYLKRARKRKSGHPIATRLLAEAWLRQKKTKQARVLIQRLLKRHPENSAARLTMAEVYLATSKKRLAIRSLAKALQGDPDNQHAKQLLFRLGH
jgi:serine/threonine protein kinase/tetratricopeptide (TPR) repeat protein